MSFRPLLFTGLLVISSLLGACTKEVPDTRLFFIGSSRFTSGNQAGRSPGDTLATRVYAIADSAGGKGLKELKVYVTYTPTRLPFAYPTPITTFIYSSLPGLPTGRQTTYLDTVFQAPYPRAFLLTSVFGLRTTSGAETWQYQAIDAAGGTSTRSFIATVRRSDSTAVYHNYLLRLNVPAQGVAGRRFVELKAGLALPRYAVLGTSAQPDTSQARYIDMVQSVDGLRLYSPDAVGSVANLPTARWPRTSRRHTLFYLTTLTPTGFAGQTDATSIQQQFAGVGTSSITTLSVNQVYAFRTQPINSTEFTYGLMRVVSVPGGTTAGLQLEVRVAKQAQAVAFIDE